MIREVFVCDCCGKDNKSAKRISVKVGRYTDAAGSMDDEYENIDLCARSVP